MDVLQIWNNVTCIFRNLNVLLSLLRNYLFVLIVIETFGIWDPRVFGMILICSPKKSQTIWAFLFWCTQISKTLLLIRKDFSKHIQGRRRNWKSGGCTYNYICKVTTIASLPIKMWGSLHPIVYTPIPYSKQPPSTKVPTPLYIGKLLQTPDGRRVVHIVKICERVITFARDCVDCRLKFKPSLLNWVAFVNCFVFASISQSNAERCLKLSAMASRVCFIFLWSILL